MDTATFVLIILVLNTKIQDNHATETVHLEGQVGQVSVNSKLPFVCSTSSPATIINWLRTTYGSTEQTAVIQQVVGSACYDNSPADLDCFCNTTLYKCEIKSVSATQAGEQWRCSASINGLLTFSNNTYTIQLVSTTVPTTESTTETPRDCNFCWTAGSIYGVTILSLGVIELIVLLLIACCWDKTQCWAFVIVVIFSLCLILGGIILLANNQKGLKNAGNIFGMVVGSIGCFMLVLLIVGIIIFGFGYIREYCISSSKASTIPKQKTVMVLRIDLKLLDLGVEIGKSEFGSVVKAVYSPKDGKNTIKIDVAVKRSHKTSINIQEGFLKEAGTMLQLSHDCLVKFLGISESKNNQLLLVEEYIKQESMLDLLRYENNNVSSQDLILWAAQIAYGMMYLEKQNIVHRDLAAKNILLHNRNLAKISVIGLSRAVGRDIDYYKPTAMGGWPIKWYAPECWIIGKFSHASDVWSFGVTLWEMFSYGRQPYEDKDGKDVTKFIENGKRLEQPYICPNVLYEEMLRCWKVKETDRPDFKELDMHFEKEYVSTHEHMHPIRTRDISKNPRP